MNRERVAFRGLEATKDSVQWNEEREWQRQRKKREDKRGILVFDRDMNDCRFGVTVEITI